MRLYSSRRDAIMSRKRKVADPKLFLAPTDPVAQATEFLRRLDVPELQGVLRRRLSGDLSDRALPGIGKEGSPGDLFLYIVDTRSAPDVTTKLGEACATLIEGMSRRLSSENPAIVGELCFLAGRMRANQAIEPLTALVRREDTVTMSVRKGEHLRTRALRCLVGLLVTYPDRLDRVGHRLLFEECLSSPGCERAALAALLRWWPESRDEFIQKLPPGYTVNDKALDDVGLLVAGFLS